MKKTGIFIPVILSAAMLLSACGSTPTAPAAETSAAESVTETSAPEISQKLFVPEKNHVKLLGRTNLYNETLWLAQTDSGCEFTFTGDSASVTIIGDSVASSGSDGSYARFAIYLNGERIIDELVTEPEKTYEIFSADEASENTVRIIKLSEAANSTLGVRDIRVNSIGDIAPTPEKELKIEFIGDSITCGYGVDDEVKEHHFSTATEDGTKTYAYKTAQLLDADYSMVCFSGHGVVSGYTTKGKKVRQLVPKYYELTAHSYGTAGDFSVTKQEWDFSDFKPDFVVVNLGTNDNSYCGGDEEYENEFRDLYKDFIVQIREKNPDAYILCTLGIMGYDLYPKIEEAVEAYSSETGDTRVSAMIFEPQNMEDGIAADWHPSEKTHEKAAARLTDEINNIIASEKE